MRIQLKVRHIALAWAWLLFGAALVLPTLSLQVRNSRGIKVAIGGYWLLLLIGTPIALVSYFKRAWRKASTMPNRGTTYIVWLSLESIAAILLFAALLFETMSVAIGCVSNQ